MVERQKMNKVFKVICWIVGIFGGASLIGFASA